VTLPPASASGIEEPSRSLKLTVASYQVCLLVDPISYLAKRGHNRRFPFAFFPLFSFLAASVDPDGRVERFSPTCDGLLAEPVSTEISEAQNPNLLIAESQSLAFELFGEVQAPTTASLWNSVVLNSIQKEVRSGLGDDIRTELLSKYEVKEDLQPLAPSKLNKVLVTVLTPFVVKRDEYQALSQTQVGACLNVFGSGMFLLLKLESAFISGNEAKSALTFLAESIHLVSDHYRLSLSRRAFTKPFLNIIDKNATDSAPMDEFMFGQNFAETFKVAQACEKTGREVSKSLPQVTFQPIQQAAQQRNQLHPTKSFLGNRRAPVRSSLARHSGASHHRSRTHRPQSQSQTRRHH